MDPGRKLLHRIHQTLLDGCRGGGTETRPLRPASGSRDLRAHHHPGPHEFQQSHHQPRGEQYGRFFLWGLEHHLLVLERNRILEPHPGGSLSPSRRIHVTGAQLDRSLAGYLRPDHFHRPSGFSKGQGERSFHHLHYRAFSTRPHPLGLFPVSPGTPGERIVPAHPYPDECWRVLRRGREPLPLHRRVLRDLGLSECKWTGKHLCYLPG